MNADGKHDRNIRTEGDGVVETLHVIDQTVLPHELRILKPHSVKDLCRAVLDMLGGGRPHVKC